MIVRGRTDDRSTPGVASLLGLTAYWLGLSILWGSLTTIVLPSLVGGLVPVEVKASALALVTALQALVAMVVQPLAGAASDRLPTRFGRRRPWLVGGVTAQALCVVGLALAGGYWTIVAIMLLVELTSNVAQGPYQALLPDTVPSSRRGLASGFLGGAQLAGQVTGVAAAGAAVGAGAIHLAILFAAGSVWLGMAVTVASVREPVGVAGAGPEAHGLASAGAWLSYLTSPRRWLGPVRTVALEVWGPDVLEQRDYLWVLASRLAILMATGCLQPFILYYLQDSIGLGAEAGLAVTPIAAVVAIVALIAAVPGGALASRWGRARMVALSGLVGAVAAIAFAAAQGYAQLLVVAAPFGVALGVFLSANWALLVEVVPADEAGRYLGLSNIVTAGAGLLAIVTAGPLADLVNRVEPGLGYRAIFLLAAVEFLVGAWCALRVREPPRPEAARAGTARGAVDASVTARADAGDASASGAPKGTGE